MIAEFTTVLPPRHLPCRTGMRARPRATCAPMSRYRRLREGKVRSSNWAAFTAGPSSTTAMEEDASDRTRAAVAPAAPDPTMT